MESVIKILAEFGITPETKPFIVLAALMGIGFWYISKTIGKPVGILKDNMIVVTTHLCTGTGNLNASLIKQMSPLQIQPEGKKILEESGFIKAFNTNKEKFFDVINEYNPNSKFEVESLAIYSYIQVMRDNKIMSDVKSYLYDPPDVRDTFPTLAGVYVRDVYLENNKNIK